MKRVYVAGAYSADNVLDVFHNIRKGMRVSTEVFLAGYTPFCPWLDFHYILMLQKDEKVIVENFYNYSMAWLEVSEAILLVPGWENSTGTKKELIRAKELGIPVFNTLEELKIYFKETSKKKIKIY